MATIKFLLQSKSDNAPIYLRLSVNRDLVIKRKTGLFINPINWSLEKALPNNNTLENCLKNTDMFTAGAVHSIKPDIVAACVLHPVRFSSPGR